MGQTVEKNGDKLPMDVRQLNRTRQKYKIHKQEYGAEIKEIYHAKREESCIHMSYIRFLASDNQECDRGRRRKKTNELILKLWSLEFHLFYFHK